MREFDQLFGPINTERWILRLYTLTDGYRSLTPAVGAVQAAADEVLEFSVDPVFGPNVQQIVWTLNGEVLTTAESNFPLANLRDGIEELPMDIKLQGGSAIDASTNVDNSALNLVLAPGQHELELTLKDISGRIRVSPPHVGIVEKVWRIDVQ